MSWEWIAIVSSALSAVAAIAASVAAVASWRTAKHQLSTQVLDHRLKSIDVIARFARRLADDPQGAVLNTEILELESSCRLMRVVLPFEDIATTTQELEVQVRTYAVDQDEFYNVTEEVIRQRLPLIGLCNRLQNAASAHLSHMERILNKH